MFVKFKAYISYVTEKYPHRIAYVILGLACLASLITVLKLVHQNRQLINTTAVAQIKACKEDQKFRYQYKVRAEAEKKLLDLFIYLSKQNIKKGGKQKKVSEEFIKTFEPLTKKIHILPLRDCNKLGEDIKKDLPSTLGID